MNMPDVLTEATDPRSQVQYQVYAYRQLTREEMELAVRMYLSNQKKKPKKGSCVTIYSIIGEDTRF
jgi:hypothetical protein